MGHSSEKEGVLEPYKPPALNGLEPRFKDPQGYWVGIADAPLVFMTNRKFLAENKLQPPASWNSLLPGTLVGLAETVLGFFFAFWAGGARRPGSNGSSGLPQESSYR
jgi:hypothetical protein